MLFPVIHRGAEQILIRCTNRKVITDVIKQLPKAKWSHTYRSWYLPLSLENYKLICSSLEPLATLSTDELRNYLVKRKAVNDTGVPKDLPIKVEKEEKARPAPVKVPEQPQPSVVYNISYENLVSLKQAIDKLVLKGYSNSTIKTYRAELMIFFQVLGKHRAASLDTDDVKRWLLKCLNQGLTENTMHSRINALKYYYEQVLGKEKFFFDIPRPKKHQQLPNVLGEQEITRLFNALINKKHKAVLFTAYSAGLRVSEVVNLKLKDIDSDRMQLFVEKAKGKKDRYVNLSPILLDILRNYIKMCHPRPKVYLFEGQEPGSVYSARSAQKIFQVARNKAGIKKR